MTVFVRGKCILEHAHEFVICSPQLLLRGSYFLCSCSYSSGLCLFPFLAFLLSRWPSQRRDSELCLLHSFLTPFLLCQIGAGQFHPLHVSVICTSVSTLFLGWEEHKALVLGLQLGGVFSYNVCFPGWCSAGPDPVLKCRFSKGLSSVLWLVLMSSPV